MVELKSFRAFTADAPPVVASPNERPNISRDYRSQRPIGLLEPEKAVDVTEHVGKPLFLAEHDMPHRENYFIMTNFVGRLDDNDAISEHVDQGVVFEPVATS